MNDWQQKTSVICVNKTEAKNLPVVQVIVIATADWQVLCFTPALELVWRTSLLPAEALKEAYIMKAMDVLVTSHSVKKNDGGLVIIGGSMLHKSHLQAEEDEWVNS